MKAEQTENSNDKIDPETLAKHLRYPQGKIGKMIGNEMNKSNYHINTNAFNLLDLRSGDSILEIGFGNGKLIPDLLKRATNLDYCGVDLSEIMVEEATTINEKLIKNGSVELMQGSINQLCYKTDIFDKIITVNTIYFWDNAKEVIEELHRVLKPNGLLIIGFRDKELVQSMPFTKFGFTLYDGNEVTSLIKTCDFQSVELIIKQEPAFDFEGENLTLTGSFIVAKK